MNIQYPLCSGKRKRAKFRKGLKFARLVKCYVVCVSIQLIVLNSFLNNYPLMVLVVLRKLFVASSNKTESPS